MLVYGDPRFSASGESLVGDLRRRLAAAGSQDLEAWRALMIQAGQLEQGVADALEGPAVRAAEGSTDFAADLFLEVWRGGGRVDGRQQTRLHDLLAGAATPARLEIKVPEGFEIYGLFPEQYALAAERWSERTSAGAHRAVTVIGLRSIGTTLSAVVGASLRRLGWAAARQTVRPTGHPFQRQVDAASLRVTPGHPVLVVDEGPGASGSSLAAVVLALRRRGVPMEAITLMPGHGGPPGEQAGPEVRALWEQCHRVVTALEEVRWRGDSLESALRRGLAASEACGGTFSLTFNDGPCPVGASPLPWTRRKAFGHLSDGRRVVAKFAGLGAQLRLGTTQPEQVQARLTERSTRGWSHAPLGFAQGHVLLPWCEGSPGPDPTSPGAWRAAADYLLGEPMVDLDRLDSSESWRTLGTLLVHNAVDSLGEDHRASAEHWVERARGRNLLRAATDLRMDPSHWISGTNDRWWKVSGWGPGADHTCPGRPPLEWDVAGVTMGWRLGASARLDFLRTLERGGLRFDAASIRFHEAAWLALALGVATLTANPSARGALQAALQRVLEAESSPSGVRRVTTAATIENTPKAT